MKLESARTFLRRLTDKPISGERKAKREDCEIPCYLFATNGLATAGLIQDRSSGGVRIKCDDVDAQERAAYVLRMDTGAAHALRLAWRVGPFAGYELLHRVDRRSKPADAAVLSIRAAWQEHLEAFSPMSAPKPQG